MGSTPDASTPSLSPPGPTRPDSASAQSPSPQGSGARLALSVHDAAEALGLSVDTVYELVRGNKLPHKRIGRRILIPCRVLETWINAQDAWASFDGS